ncbi:unnamed protein product [Phytophthora fragariaefolia]|uniref:Unnamed protein product n=1 Tax=Phytophthora fragariaefolia TaxID=1490495 RepID=A0A9W6Y2Y2_9STRA|nr:unnamed protein product [Phytophthora fragariaefolia]
MREEASTPLSAHTANTNQQTLLTDGPPTSQPQQSLQQHTPQNPSTSATQDPFTESLHALLADASQESVTDASQESQADTADQTVDDTYEETPEPPVTSVLHPITPQQEPLNPDVAFRIKMSKAKFEEYEESFPQYGKIEPGRHYRIHNPQMLTQLGNRESNSVLLICLFNDANSWGGNRSVTNFFDLVGSFDYPKEKISIAMLTSSLDEFAKVRTLFSDYIQHYPRLSIIFRDDFALGDLTRDNRHEGPRQADRRRMIARYRNYALLSTLETWHQHVLWVDADIKTIPSHLLPKMVHSGLDILTPTCMNKHKGFWINYDQNGWVGQRMVRPVQQTEGKFFMPGPLHAKLLDQVEDKSQPFTPMDSVGGTMLYVRAEVHRQGVMFPVHYVIGGEWGREGYDGIETEGLCYTAHFLGFKCWGLVNETIIHTEEF